MHLFALVREETPRIHRVQLHQELQGPIQHLFAEQGARLLAEKDVIEFEAGHNPESDEVHRIAGFADTESLLASSENALDYPVFTDEMLDRLVALFVVAEIEGEQSAIFQIFDRRRALTQGRLTVVRIGQGYRRLEGAGFVLDNHATAVLQEGDLYFSKFAPASRIFDLVDYFHEATDDDLEAFAGMSAVSVDDQAHFLKLADSSRIRKQITLVLESEVLSNVDVGTIVRKAKKEAGLKISTGGSGRRRRIVMPDTRKELKNVLDFLQENYYKGCLSGTGFVANSKREART